MLSLNIFKNINKKSILYSVSTLNITTNFGMDNENIALSRNNILSKVWNYEYYGDSRTIDSHIKKIRHKLGKKGRYIQTIRGIGYKFQVDED